MWNQVCLAHSLPNSKEFILHIELCQLTWEKVHTARFRLICSRGCFHPQAIFMNSIKVNSLVCAQTLMPPTPTCVYWLVTVLLSWSSLGKSFHALWREQRQTSQGVGSTGLLKLWILFYLVLYYTDLKPKEDFELQLLLFFIRKGTGS